MKVLFDHNVPKKLRTLLSGHEISTAQELGWDTLQNGDLLQAAEDHGFDAMLSGDKNMSYQQNLEGRKLALVILADTDWPTLKQNPAPVGQALDLAKPGSFKRLTEPVLSRHPPRRSGPQP